MRNELGRFIKGNHVSTEFKKGHKLGMTGKHFSKKSKEKMRKSHVGQIPWNKNKKGLQISWCKGTKGIVKANSGSFKKGQISYRKGKKFPTKYKDGTTKGRNNWQREYRHRKGINKKYQFKYGGERIPKKRYKQRRIALMKAAGPLTIQTIQRVYEDNIKKYGTLTCIYCLKLIKFGQDTLEHKQPLSRGGTNLYENLAIACKYCNTSKGNKTVEEYLLNLRRKKCFMAQK